LISIGDHRRTGAARAELIGYFRPSTSSGSARLFGRAFDQRIARAAAAGFILPEEPALQKIGDVAQCGVRRASLDNSPLRARENLKLALRLREGRGPLTEQQVRDIAAALDAAAVAIERS
jgi:hypothetical protein